MGETQQQEHDWPRRVTYSWAGEPGASESIKRINGVEVARNVMPGFWGWTEGADSVEILSPSHAVLSGDQAYFRGRGYAEPGSQVAIFYEARSSTPDLERGDGTAYVLTNFTGFTARNGRGVRIPADGQWHYSGSGDTSQTVENGPWAFAFRVGANNVPPDMEVRNVHAWIGSAEERPEFFNGDTEDYTEWPTGTTAISSFTRDWWGRLPRYVQDADRVQEPTPYPLLRFLDGVGFHAGVVREYVWDMWSGVAVDPRTAPDALLPWISYLLGLADHHRDHGPRHLRETVLAHVGGGTNQPGTRGHIAAMVRPFLEPGAQLLIRASTRDVNTLVIGVDPGDVPGQDYQKLMRQIRVSGIVPAGHALLVQDLRATWDEWESTAGATWAEKERNIRTWQESDQAGVELL